MVLGLAVWLGWVGLGCVGLCWIGWFGLGLLVRHEGKGSIKKALGVKTSQNMLWPQPSDARSDKSCNELNPHCCAGAEYRII